MSVFTFSGWNLGLNKSFCLKQMCEKKIKLSQPASSDCYVEFDSLFKVRALEPRTRKAQHKNSGKSVVTFCQKDRNFYVSQTRRVHGPVQRTRSPLTYNVLVKSDSFYLLIQTSIFSEVESRGCLLVKSTFVLMGPS